MYLSPLRLWQGRVTVTLKILFINPPYLTLTSLLATGHQIPLGLLMVGGPLLDAGHVVRLLDAERHHLSYGRIVEAVKQFSMQLSSFQAHGLGHGQNKTIVFRRTNKGQGNAGISAGRFHYGGIVIYLGPSSRHNQICTQIPFTRIRQDNNDLFSLVMRSTGNFKGSPCGRA